MKVIASDPFIDQSDIELEINGQTLSVNIPTITFDEVLANADFISLHVPMPSDGKALIGEDEFNKMKDGVRIVNAARGGVIDEDELINALNNGKVAAAALDVFVGEPSPRNDVINHEKISITPHIGAATLEAQNRIGTELADKIISFYKK
jgi:D-3-phosphoglycerate dehydrogenase